jgi:hypothetical protein
MACRSSGSNTSSARTRQKYAAWRQVKPRMSEYRSGISPMKKSSAGDWRESTSSMRPAAWSNRFSWERSVKRKVRKGWSMWLAAKREGVG